ncbi:MAG: hypothetical protein HN759_07645 [Akkermansiaceae bacterium]|jgi:hypothetical protein|nr:hypothetical protein [Akkermansiaceae bacterium]
MKRQLPGAGKIKGNINHLYDHKPSTSCELIGEQSKCIIEYDFRKPVTLNGLDANYGGNSFMRIWYQKGDNWVPLVWDNYTVSTNHHPTFPDTTARLWRVEIHEGRSKNFQTLRFYHNPHRILKNGQLPQMKSANYLPPIQPQ